MQASVSGNVHFLAEDDADAVALVRRLITGRPIQRAARLLENNATLPCSAV